MTAAAALGEGGGVDEQGRPLVIAGNRGILYVRLTVQTLAKDAHSGTATLLPNAAARLTAALSTLVRPDGAPSWPGLWHGVAPLSAAARESVRNMPLHLLDEVRDEFAVTTFVDGLDGYDAFEAEVGRPTCNIQSLSSGDTGPTGRNVVPARASARIDMRLVPDQDPESVLKALREHLRAHGFADAEVEEIGPAACPYWADLTDPLIGAAADATEAAFGKPAIRVQSIGGTAPMYEVCGRDGVPMVYISAGDIHANAHAPDESLSIATARAAALAFLRLIETLARSRAV